MTLCIVNTILENVKKKRSESAIKEQLVAALDDTERYENGYLGPSLLFPRLCDMAAWRLAEAWKMPAAFDPRRAQLKRDRQRIELANVWRKRQGLAPLPVPGSRAAGGAPDAGKSPSLVADVRCAWSGDLGHAAGELRGKPLDLDD